MQRYRILHRTYYNFSSIVSLGPHELRLRPREGHELHIQSATLEIEPLPLIAWRRDAEDNCVAVATFNTPAMRLAIVSDLVVAQYGDGSTGRKDDVPAYPFAYSPADQIALAPYLGCVRSQTTSVVHDWVEHVRSYSAGRDTIAMLERLCAATKEKFTYRVRDEAGTQSAEETLRLGSGSCRDFARLFMDTARQLGLAARFVSGYLHAEPSSNNYGATHAWAEVYLPGAGWKGFDPTLGFAAGADHFAVAVARSPEQVPPVSGSISGSATSTLQVGVWVSSLS